MRSINLPGPLRWGIADISWLSPVFNQAPAPVAMPSREMAALSIERAKLTFYEPWPQSIWSIHFATKAQFGLTSAIPDATALAF
jgi:hypothetical protein